MLKGIAFAAEQKSTLTAAVVPNVVSSETPTKKIARLIQLKDAAQDSATKQRYQKAISMENDKILAEYNL